MPKPNGFMVANGEDTKLPLLPTPKKEFSSKLNKNLSYTEKTKI